MAVTSYGVNASEAVKVWSRKLFRESLKSTWLAKFMGEGTDSALQVLDDLAKGPGDRITNILRMQLAGEGVEGDATLEGTEEALVTYTDNFLISQLRHAVRSAGKVTEQRIPFSIREEARQGLQDWFSDRIDTALFNQLAGNTAQTDTKYTGHNAAIAPDSAHKVTPGTVGGTAEASLSASQIMSFNLIDKAVEKAKVASPVIRPLRVDGNEYFLLFLHPYQVTDLRTDTTAGNWFDVQSKAMQGGRVSDNPIFTGALGVYNGVILHESTRVPLGVNTSDVAVSNTRRAVMCGAQAGVVAFGRDNGFSRMTWMEDLFDYGNQFGVAAGLIWGAKKNRFNSADFSTIVISTYAAAH